MHWVVHRSWIIEGQVLWIGETPSHNHHNNNNNIY